MPHTCLVLKLHDAVCMYITRQPSGAARDVSPSSVRHPPQMRSVWHRPDNFAFQHSFAFLPPPACNLSACDRPRLVGLVSSCRLPSEPRCIYRTLPLLPRQSFIPIRSMLPPLLSLSNDLPPCNCILPRRCGAPLPDPFSVIHPFISGDAYTGSRGSWRQNSASCLQQAAFNRQHRAGVKAPVDSGILAKSFSFFLSFLARSAHQVICT